MCVYGYIYMVIHIVFKVLYIYGYLTFKIIIFEKVLDINCIRNWKTSLYSFFCLGIKITNFLLLLKVLFLLLKYKYLEIEHM